MNTKIHLSDSERAAIRAQGGTAYVAVLAVRGPRGAKYRPIRSEVYRTEEQASERFASLRRRYCLGKQLFYWGGTFLVDATGDAEQL